MHTDFKNKKIAILGFGVEGLASAEYLQQKGAVVTVLDEKSDTAFDTSVLRTIQKHAIRTIFGKQAFSDLLSYDMLVRSPGIRRFTKPLDDAAAKGVIVTSQTQLFFDLCPCPIIGVTGTKGKGTTSSLIYEMLKEQKRSGRKFLPGHISLSLKHSFSKKTIPRSSIENVYLGGNIGRPPFTFLDTLTPQSMVVLEMSSYQLQDMHISPHIAVMLMITSEHLIPDRVGSLQNYHPDIADYVNAKRNIIRFQTEKDFAILNRDYPATNESDIHTAGKVYYVSREREVKQGCFVKGGRVILRMSGEIPRLARPTSRTPVDICIIKTSEILLPGKHNWENVCAAVTAATLAGVDKQSIVSVLKTFKGLEHRLELVGEVNGVKYYDDSFATTPETAIAAIEAFTSPEILILGGSSKKSDFTELGRTIERAKNIKAIIGIGLEWERIKERFTNYDLRIMIYEGCNNMKEIIKKAAEIAQPGDVVLLSPACASFGMFANYKDRGEQFKREVSGLD